MAKTVVILGGSYAGLHVAHRLLKTTRQAIKDLKVIVVSKNSHFYWNLASPRALVSGSGVSSDQLLHPIADILSRYPSDSYELVIGSADKVDTDAKTVQVSLTAHGDVDTETPRSITYDQLVVATGSRPIEVETPWKASNGCEELRVVLDELRGNIQSGKTILIAGGGATGVELAGELGHAYGKDKEITLLSGSSSLLGGDSIGGNAASELAKLGVKVQNNAKVANATKLDDGHTEITIDGEAKKLSVDVYLPTMGVIPNTEFLDPRHLRDDGYAAVNASFGLKDAKNVWAVGDVVSQPRGAFHITQKHAGQVAVNVESALKEAPEKEPTVVKGFPFDVMLCTIGRSRGVGRIGALKVFSFMVMAVKGDMGLSQMPKYVDGSVA